MDRRQFLWLTGGAALSARRSSGIAQASRRDTEDSPKTVARTQSPSSVLIPVDD